MKTLVRLIILFALISLIQFSCKKTPIGEMPVVSTSDVVGITSFTALGGGVVTGDGGADVTERGLCWSTSSQPTVSDNKFPVGKGTGSFTYNIRGLDGNTAYYLAAYATNSAGTAYGNIITFTTPPSVTDIDGNTYATVVIGTQTWMAENLKSTSYRNGDPITYIATADNWEADATEAYCDYDLIGKISDVYGNFYNWYAVSDSRKLAPSGWHVATFDEWTALVDYLEGIDKAGQKMKEIGYTHWLEECGGNGTNISGFTALPAGYAGKNHRSWEGRFWSSTEEDLTKAKYLFLDCSDMITLANDDKTRGYSVRCVKD